MTDSARDVLMGELKGQLGALLLEMQSATESRKETYRRLEGMALKLQSIESTMSSLDKRIAALEPGVMDYLDLKKKAEGAGWFGRMLWVFGGMLLTAAAGFVTWASGILAWLRHP